VPVPRQGGANVRREYRPARARGRALPPPGAYPALAPAARPDRRRSARRRIGRTEFPARSRRGSDRTKPGAAPGVEPVEQEPAEGLSGPVGALALPAALLTGSRSSNRTDLGLNSGCRTSGTACPEAGLGVQIRSSAPRGGRHRRRPAGDSRNRGKTRGLPGYQRRSDRTSRADGTPLVRTSQEDFC
jgi:hypothetical protein